MPRESKSNQIKRLNMKTELQWNKLNRCVIDRTERLDYFNNTYYAEASTREMSADEIKDFKNRRKAEADGRKQIKQREEERLEKEYEKASQYSTAFQWLNEGRVVVPGAKAVSGEHYIGKSADYYYYHIDDTYGDTERAEELLKTFPEKYDGRKWW